MRILTQIAKYIISSVIFCLIIASYSFAQRNYLFENISIPEGLSNSTVQSIFQDRNGFLWVSTADGLNRYDGNTIVVFKNDPNDSTSIPNNNCFAIAEDADGFLWVGVYGNEIARYDPKNEKFATYSVETGGVTRHSEFLTAFTDSKGRVWFGSTNHGIQRFDISTNKFEQVHLDSSNINGRWGNVFSITELENGDILAADYGYGLKIYNENLNLFQPYFLKTNFSPEKINVIYEDESGNIWFGGVSKLIKYVPQFNEIEDYNLLGLFKNPTANDNITGIVQDDEGFIWIGVYSQGLFRVDPETRDVRKFDYGVVDSDIAERTIIQTLFKDKYGILWISTWGSGLTKFDPLREPFNYSKLKALDISGSGASSVTVIAGSQQENEIIVGTSTKGLFSYNLESKKSDELKINFDHSARPVGVINIQSLALDHAGNIWFSFNNSGLNKLDEMNSLIAVRSPHERKSTSYNISSIKIDLSGNIWIASHYGFEKFNPGKNEFTLFPTIMTKKMNEALDEKVREIPKSREPLASILEVGEASNLEKNFTLLSDQKVLIISVGEGRMSQGNDGLYDKGSLFSGDGKQIWSMDDLSRTFNAGGGFKNRIAVECIDLKKGDYKITFSTDVGNSYGNWNVLPPTDSAWYGIQVLSLSESEFMSIQEMNQKEISADKYLPLEIGSCIEFSKRYPDVIWLGSRFNSFFKYDLASGNFRQYNYDLKNKFSPSNSITNIFEDKEGIVWVATVNCLVRFDPETEKIETYDQKDGLPSSLVNSIIEDLQGNLWISTSVGLSKLNKNAPGDKWNFVNFDTRDGLRGFTNSTASWISKEGEIIFGSIDGITSFFPGKINEVKPDIVICDIKVNDISLKSDSALVKPAKSILWLEELDLSFTQNNISFEFASIHFSRPEKNKIIYMLEGFNDQWKSTDRNFVSYTNLSPGEYTFRIKGSNGDGIWNDEGVSLRIMISPPWWKTTWAYISYGILFLLIIYGIDRVQRRRILEKQQRLAKDKELSQAKEIEKAYLELGKAHETLKSTQSQLIQSEKMASLGELTAGIAHEIQNPLNFVNNFAEVSLELIDEMKQESAVGGQQLAVGGRRSAVSGQQSAIEIIDDIRQNLDKILHHGKRADAIVKGMLLHSRASSGQKEPTDINALADEYLRLAYHGLRAKDRTFNAVIKTDFDASVGKINIIPQDIGRVILNLITNAFYAVDEKKKHLASDLSALSNLTGQNSYEPTVWVSTKFSLTLKGEGLSRSIGNRGEVLISVKDNGDGIPDEIRDKIFQPFFTTKPTGEGTGLGLSISYDIITKGHGGKLNLDTIREEGSNFTIILPV